MGREAVRDLAQSEAISEVVVADSNATAARELAASLESPKVSWKEVDLRDRPRLIQVLKEGGLTLNCAGPFYDTSTQVAEAALAAGVHYVDIADDHEVIPAMLELDKAAQQAGVTILSGLGASPGISNMWAVEASRRLDRMDEVHIAYAIHIFDSGGRAVAYHHFHVLSKPTPIVMDGAIQMIRARSESAVVDFPEPVGRLTVYNVGHPEPLTLSRRFPQLRRISVKGCVYPMMDLQNALIDLGFASEEPITIEGTAVRPLDVLVAVLQAAPVPGQAGPSALRLEARGVKDGRPCRWIASGLAPMSQATGASASIAAQMLASGAIGRPGVVFPEDVIDPDSFMAEFLRRGYRFLERTEVEVGA